MVGERVGSKIENRLFSARVWEFMRLPLVRGISSSIVSWACPEHSYLGNDQGFAGPCCRNSVHRQGLVWSMLKYCRGKEALSDRTWEERESTALTSETGHGELGKRVFCKSVVACQWATSGAYNPLEHPHCGRLTCHQPGLDAATRSLSNGEKTRRGRGANSPFGLKGACELFAGKS